MYLLLNFYHLLSVCASGIKMFVRLHLRSSAHGISFEIPLDDSSSSGRGLSRSASTEGLGFKVHHAARGMRRNLSFQPVNGNAHSKIHEEDDKESNRQISRHRLGTYTGYAFCTFLSNLNPQFTHYLPLVVLD